MLRLPALLLAVAGLLGCATAASPPPNAARGAVEAAPVPQVDYRCRSAADCAVKNVGNCCGAYPACVNKDSPTFPEQVKADCAREGRMAICGFPAIQGCQCVAGRCENVTGAATAPAEVR